MDQSNVVTKQTGPRPPTKPSGPVGVVPPATPKKEEKQFPIPEFIVEEARCVIPDDVRGVFVVTGRRGYGKTNFATGITHPKKTVMIDFESKGESIAKGLGIKNYFCPTDEAAGLYGVTNAPIHYYRRTKQIIEALPQDAFSCLILDNATYLQDGALEEVLERPTLYHVNQTNAEKGSYGGAWPGVKSIIGRLVHVARSRGIKVIVATFQLRPAWVDNKPSLGKLTMTKLSTWQELSILTLILQPGETKPPAPAAYVMKEQLPLVRWNEELGEKETIRRIPHRLPIAEMKYVRHYLDNPANFANPPENEKIPPGALDPYSDIFSREQIVAHIEMMKAAAKLAEIEAATGRRIGIDAPDA